MSRTHALIVSTSLAGLLLTVSSGALAQQFGGTYSTNQGGNYGGYAPQRNDVDNIGADDGQFVFGFDRISSLAFDSQKVTHKNNEGEFEHTYKSTSLNLLGVDASSPSQLPRFALDYVIAAGVTAGVSLSFATRSLSLDGGAEQQPEQPPSVHTEGTTFFGGARAGYAYPFDETFGLWPRGGLSYTVSTGEYGVTEQTTGVTTTYGLTSTHLQLNIEVLAVISPVEHTAFMVGPYVDLGLYGKLIAEQADADDDRRNARLTSFGLVIHAVGYY